MSILKIKDQNGNWQSIPAIKGENGTNGRDGAIQYTAGENITIENNVISANLSNYYTKNDIDERLPILTIFLNSQNPFSFSSKILNDTETLTSATNVINKFYSLGNKNGFLLNRIPASGAVQSQMFTSNTLLNVQVTSYIFYGIPTYFDGLYYDRSLTINGNWVDNVFTATSVKTTGANTFIPTNYLAKNNTTSFTPTANYHPATKKYVDDAIDAIPTGGTDSKYIYEGKTSEYTSSNRLSLNDLSLGLHVFFVDSASLLVKATINGTDYNQSITTPYNNMLSFDNLVYILKEQEIPDTVTSDITFGKTYFSDFTQSGYIEKIGNDISIRTYGIVMTQNIFITSNYRSCTLNTAQTISGIKTFTALPEASIAPTTNNQLTNKKYVDDAIASAITTTLGGEY